MMGFSSGARTRRHSVSWNAHVRPRHRRSVIDCRCAINERTGRDAPGREGRGHMARILIVEDEPSLREVERDILRDEGYETLEAADGAEALALLRGSAEAFVVLLDNRLPDMEGGDLL